MLGYACINMTLAAQKVTVTRGMIKRTFQAKGIKYASELALANFVDLYKVVQWNEANDIRFFRMSSNMVPWASEFQLTDLPDYDRIAKQCKRIGEYVREHNHRVTFHPGPFNVLVSPNQQVVDNTIKELTHHGEVMDLLGLDQSPYYKINIHCNGVYGDKQVAMKRFIDNFGLLPDSVAKRLTVENDDKASMYSVDDLMFIHDKTGIPLVFDYHHHKFCDGGMSEQEALALAVSTWKDIKPVVHYSESKRDHENSNAKPQAHSDYVTNEILTYGHDVDIMLEAKAKELALIKYAKDDTNA